MQVRDRHLPVRGRQGWQVTLWRQRRSDPGSAHARFRRTLANMTSRRSVVDYGLARRATLASVLSGRTTVTDVCDAHPYLLRAAKFHGEPTDTRCPICRKVKLTHVTYVYGDELGRYEGRVKRGQELDEMLPNTQSSRYTSSRSVRVAGGTTWRRLMFSAPVSRLLGAVAVLAPATDSR